MSMKSLRRRLKKELGGRVDILCEEDCVRLVGECDDWQKIVEIGHAAAKENPRRKQGIYVVNDINYTGPQPAPMRLPDICDDTLEGAEPDVLVIGGGISGCSIARELTAYKLSVLLVEKESDVAMHASGRNDGEVHPGIDLGKGTKKQEYVIKGNAIYGDVCAELGVPFRRCGQYVGFVDGAIKPIIRAYAWQRRVICGVRDARIISRNELLAAEPNINPAFKFGLYTPTAGVVCPYGLTIAYAENAITNGARVSLNTAVLSMELCDGEITGVKTNRGTVRPKLVINAAGAFAEDIAKMAGDRFYSIHPRKGTDVIFDKKVGHIVSSIVGAKRLKNTGSHTKGGGLINTVDHNILAGPDALETCEKEDFSTTAQSQRGVIEKQRETGPELRAGDAITAFSGIRAPSFEEDFVIEKGRKTKNLIHCAAIQSPGITTAPAVAKDVALWSAQLLNADKNPDFDPIRKPIPSLRELSDDERSELIRQNPDYGVMVCRCEEISRGEIIDALNSPLCVPTVDGVKKRVRPGMGRCQGGFCAPIVMKIIAEHQGVPLCEVSKKGSGSDICFGETKNGGEML